MIDKLLETIDTNRQEALAACVAIALLILSVVITLAIIAGWVAIVIYWIIPISIDSRSGVDFIRVMLSIGGGVIIGTIYVVAFIHIVDQ